jgi:uncharacterized protein involved in cysteine biosynthesis
MEHILEAGRLLARERRLWPFIWRPLAGSLVAFVLLFGLGLYFVENLAGRYTRGQGNETLISAAVGLAYAVLWIFVGAAVFLAIAALLSSFLWDRLSEEVELLTTGTRVEAKLPWSTVMADSVARLVFTVTLAIVGICCAATTGVGGWFIAGLIGLFDFTANAFLRRGVTLGGQFGRVFRLRGWLTFLLLGGLLTLLPFINVLLLPVMVAAGTIMVAKSERPAVG